MRKTLLSLLMLCLVYYTKAQHKLPSLDFTPQSPIASAFTRYGEIPVDLSTGVPNISIPIYTLNSHGITVPISLSYHSSGIKVQDIASQVGLGWTLNVGGVITRTVLGMEDEKVENGYTHRPRWRNAALFEEWGQTYALAGGRYDAGYNLYYTDLDKNYYDYYSDRFYYSLGNGESGIFRKDFETGEIRMMPYRPLKVKLDLVYTDGKIEITAADGTVYYFKGHYDQWSLTKIVNSNKTDSVMFYSHNEYIRYPTFNDYSYYSSHYKMTSSRYEAELQPTGWKDCLKMERVLIPTYQRFSSGTDGDQEVVLMDSIVSSDAVVRFSYLTDRTDYRLYDTNGVFALPKSRLTKIQVFNKVRNISVKEVNFTQSYFGNPANHLTKRLRLDKVQTGASQEEEYTFKYNSTQLPAYPTGHDRFSEDFWGYYNGESNITSLYYEFTPSGVAGCFPNEEYAKACILEEIKYPTGGKTVFEYESNRVNRSIYGFGFDGPKVPADGKIGGLRIKKIASYAHDGAKPQVKQYEYEIYATNYYNRELTLSKFAYRQDLFFDYYITNWQRECLGLDNSFYGSRNVCYARPMGHIIGTGEAPLIYNKVHEYYGDGNTNTGKAIYTYDVGPPLYMESFGDEPRFQGPYWRDWGKYEPRLQLKEDFKNDNGVYKIVRKTSTAYTVINEQAFPTGFNLESDLDFVSMTPGAFEHAFDRYNNEVQNNGLAEYYYNNIHFSDCIGHTGLHLPERTEVYDYVDDNNYVLTTTSYEYNGYGQQIATNVTTSKGDVIKTKFTHPVDYPAQAPYNTMVARNNISPVIEQSTYKSTTTPEVFLQSTKINYNYWDPSSQTWGNSASNQILPQAVETKKGTNPSETRIRYFSYDNKDNPVYVTKENDTRQIYFWGYNKTYPVAHVVNVAADQKTYIAYNSFEDVTSWPVFSGMIVDDNTAPTGKKCLLIRSSGLNYALNSNYAWILSYWYKTGSSINVSGNSTILTTSQPKNGWIYVKRRITGTSGITISSGTTTSYIDEVRLYPETAQMTTFAYEPLVGMTAQCDVNDRIAYYTYDASGRLTLVKDDDGHVLKKICYNFQGQPDACGESSTALWQPTGAATRCKPCPQNSNYTTNIRQQEERDNNPNSDTYGNLRWTDMDAGTWPYCVVQPGWENTTNTRCVTVNNQNTGEQEVQQIDANPCSGTYGQTRWTSAGTNTAACPLPPVFRSAPINRYYLKEDCGSQQIPVPYLVNLAEGAFISSNSEGEANALAEQEAQRLANVEGSCTTVYVRLTIEGQYTDPSGETTQANMVFRFYSNSAGTPGTEISLPSSLVINYYTRQYDTDENGEIIYDYTGAPGSLTISAGLNHFVLSDVAISNCFTDWCMNFQYWLASGRYVIIP